MIARNGENQRECTRPIDDGRTLSRPIENMTRTVVL
jgi:hypothetical protein